MFTKLRLPRLIATAGAGLVIRYSTRLVRLLVAIASIAVAACGGGASTTPITSVLTEAVVQLGAAPVTATIPPAGGISGTLSFPAMTNSATLDLAASSTAPTGVSFQRRRRASVTGTLAVYEYVTIVPSTTITLPSLPALSLTFPASISTRRKSFFYALSLPSVAQPPADFSAHGPADVLGQTATYPAEATPLTLIAGQQYTFMVYATSGASASGQHIYVAYDGGVKIFNTDGSPADPAQIVTPLGVAGLAVDSAGKIYLSNSTLGTVTTYTPDGLPTTPTITGLKSPAGIAVDGAGKIYVVSGGVFSQSSSVTTYRSDGTPSGPTITNGLFGPYRIAVDRFGTIHVVNIEGGKGSTYQLVSYTAQGVPTTPNLNAGDESAQYADVAVDQTGKIFVADENGGVESFLRNGLYTTPQINTVYADAIAVDDAGKIYVGTNRTGTVQTFLADGTRTIPTLTLTGTVIGLTVH